MNKTNLISNVLFFIFILRHVICINYTFTLCDFPDPKIMREVEKSDTYEKPFEDEIEESELQRERSSSETVYKAIVEPMHRSDNVKMIAVHSDRGDTAGVYIIAVVAGISAAATVGLIAFGIGWYK